MASYSSENYFSEADLEQRTESLLKDLEAAKDPIAYRQRFHDRFSEDPTESNAQKGAATRTKRSSAAPRSSAATVSRSHVPRKGISLMITALAILAGVVAGSLLSTYLA